MSETLVDRIKHAWNAFKDPDEEHLVSYGEFGSSYGIRPDRPRLNLSSERSIIASIYTRIGIDVASVAIKHVKLDEDSRYSKDINSGLNNCLTLEANIDQPASAFRQNMATSLLDKGVIAIVPVDTTLNPLKTGGFDIQTMRVAEVTAWFPRHVRVMIYNDRIGQKQELTLPKSLVAIVENPLYSVMNEPNSTLQRLIRKLALLDRTDDQVASGKLDLIMQLPYVIKSEARREQAEKRRKDIELQLKGSQYGIAYTDGTERITQLNRPAENNLLKQITDLTGQLYGQLGLTPGVFDGTADEKEMLNYQNRTVEPILRAITEAMTRTFLTKTARSQMQTIGYFKEPFKLVAVADLAEIADKFTRNEILSSNEVRAIIGLSPSKDPEAEELRNKNLPKYKDKPKLQKEGELQNGT